MRCIDIVTLLCYSQFTDDGDNKYPDTIALAIDVVSKRVSYHISICVVCVCIVCVCVCVSVCVSV